MTYSCFFHVILHVVNVVNHNITLCYTYIFSKLTFSQNSLDFPIQNSFYKPSRNITFAGLSLAFRLT